MPVCKTPHSSVVVNPIAIGLKNSRNPDTSGGKAVRIKCQTISSYRLTAFPANPIAIGLTNTHSPWYKFYTCIILCIAACSSCHQKNTRPYENELGIKPANLARIDTPHYTTIEWTNPVRNLGVVREGDSVVLKFRFKNTGDHPLFIAEVRPSCGCTVPHYSEEAIMPGEEDELTVNFNSMGQSGPIHKTILVTTNTTNGVNHLLSFDGRVDSLQRVY
jgi:Protein of unknown function (DUF1573)